MSKTKPISKSSKKKEPKKLTDENGDPLIQNLNDFLTSIKIKHSSLPIFTGGRIQATPSHIYATCNDDIAIYSFQEGTVVDRIKHVHVRRFRKTRRSATSVYAPSRSLSSLLRRGLCCCGWCCWRARRSSIRSNLVLLPMILLFRLMAATWPSHSAIQSTSSPLKP